MSAFRIRAAQLNDAAEIARLTLELGYPGSEQKSRSTLAAILKQPQHFVAVAAADDGSLWGWVHAECRLMLESGEKAELVGLVVSSAARQQGVGKALVVAAENWARQQGMGAICVRSSISRGESHPFYQAIGYMRKKTQHVYEKSLKLH